MSRVKRAYRVASRGVTVLVCATSADRAFDAAAPTLMAHRALRNVRDVKIVRAYDMDYAAQAAERSSVMAAETPAD